MHDTTSVPALVDLAAMRDLVAEAGGDPSALNPICDVATSTDHSVSVDYFGTPEAMALNAAVEMERNAERYAFLKWAEQAFKRFRVFPPGSGIMHTINLEHLATVFDVIDGPDGPLAVPDTMLGTDSHTPMINAIGVLGWGIGGLEAESAMLGEPMPLKLPEVVGVRLTGRLRDGVLATDLALHVAEVLRRVGVVGAFVEYVGSGVAGLDVGVRAAVANMAPEYGATTGYFPVDDATLRYLSETGRPGDRVAQVESSAKALGLWSRPDDLPEYTSLIDIDLESLEPSAAGPRRPYDRVALAGIPSALPPSAAIVDGSVPPGAIGIAAITSCTNSADLRMLVAAALLADAAAEHGLKPPAWVKTSFAPGSQAMLNALRRAGLMAGLERVGFHAVGIGCTTCIGNSGPLTDVMTEALSKNEGLSPLAFISGNRNFPGRIHPQVENAFLVSPPLVVAYALAGRAIDITTEPLGTSTQGNPVFLSDIWPATDRIEAAIRRAAHPSNTLDAYANIDAERRWERIAAPTGDLFPWDPESVYLRPPSFVRRALAPIAAGEFRLRILAVYGDDLTTDDISPAGAIPQNSAAADYLVAGGEKLSDLNTYASRRGNFEVMERGAFTARTLKNLFCPDAPPGHTRLEKEGPYVALRDAARQYAETRQSSAIVAGARYGQGSSRDWAAKAPALLGVRAILAQDFERIHRSNLICIGILPIELPDGWHPETLNLLPGDVVSIVIPPAPRVMQTLPIILERENGGREMAEGRLQCLTVREVEIVMAGGLIPDTLARYKV